MNVKIARRASPSFFVLLVVVVVGPIQTTAAPSPDCAFLDALVLQSNTNVTAMNWTLGGECCGWTTKTAPYPLVNCTADGRVRGIDWSDTSYRLKGPVPSLNALQALEYVDFSGTDFNGPLPDFSNLTNLTTVIFDNCEFTGSYLQPFLKNLPKLTVLSLVNNSLSGPLPTDLTGVPNLEQLVLKLNSFSGPLPQYNHSNLRNINIHLNLYVNGTLPRFDGLPNMEELHLGDNSFTGTIPPLQVMPHLTWFQVSRNQLEGPIPNLAGLVNLTRLKVTANVDMSGPLPDFAKLNITKLTRLIATRTKLSGPIPDMSKLKALVAVELSNNNLSGPVDGKIPSQVTRCFLTLGGTNPGLTQCTYDVPVPCRASGQSIAKQQNCPNPKPNTNAADCQILADFLDHSNIPNGIFWLRPACCSRDDSDTLVDCDNLGRVTGLRFSQIGLQGNISGDLSKLSKLESLDLSNNDLGGTIPDLRNLTNLKYVNLAGNDQLDGSIDGVLPTTVLSCTLDATNFDSCDQSSVPKACLSGTTFEPGPTCQPSRANVGAVAGSLVAVVAVVSVVAGYLYFRNERRLKTKLLTAETQVRQLSDVIESIRESHMREWEAGKTARMANAAEGRDSTDSSGHWFFLRVAGYSIEGSFSAKYQGAPFLVTRPYTAENNDEVDLVPGQFFQLVEVFRDGWGVGTNLDTEHYGALPLVCLRLEDTLPDVLRDHLMYAAAKVASAAEQQHSDPDSMVVSNTSSNKTMLVRGNTAITVPGDDSLDTTEEDHSQTVATDSCQHLGGAA
ncbi:L domain-like protein [Gonapodya prolifera JEL478]|uniref:L domain-like protein n=1 Tax=Gonapodya prolifera (strain JEL478) TaxID=1344416 RepID=A0A138ZY75_GONPJ|nr:L domain-like protein [Gonapodya prolifera JEL478]|eukprot:KXS09447.1 L domain-like protein [Gonapodya prolifera JEL478]